MGLVTAGIAFLEALDGSRTSAGQRAAPPPTAPSPPVQGQPLGPIVEALAIKVAQLEATVDGLKSFVKVEADRADRAAERTRRAVQRAVERLEGGPGEQDPDSEVPTDDGQPGGVQWLPAVPNGVATTPRSDEDIRAEARRALMFAPR